METHLNAEPAVSSPWGGLRRSDQVVGAAAAVAFALLWLVVPVEWSPAHSGGKWLLASFVVTSGLAAALASHFLLRLARGEVRTDAEPAAWLGVQVLFWNPLAYRGVLAIAEGVGVPNEFAGVGALIGAVALGLPTSLLGAALCRSPSWIATYLFRALTCLFVTWIPLIPALVFLHVILFAHLVTWNKYGALHRLAVYLVVAEQLLAFLWAFLFGRFS